MRRPAALPEHELADAAQLALRKARRVDVREQVGAVAMVIVVRHHHADLVQRTGPQQLAPHLGTGLRLHARVEVLGDRGDALRLLHVDQEAALQLAHRSVADVVSVLAHLGRLQALVEIEDHALAQRAARRLQRLDALSLIHI